MPIVVSQPQAQTPSADAQSPDGKIRATVLEGAAGVFIRVDYTSMLTQLGYEWPNPFRLTIWRQLPGGEPEAVRGASNIAQYGAIVHAYDDEVTFGQNVTYWAEAPTRDGGEIVETDKVVVSTWEPDGGFTQPGVWIKNLENPDLSVPARCLDWSGGAWASRNATADIWGASQPAVTTDVRKSYNTKMTVLTADEDEYQALLAAVDASVVYIVGLERHRRRTGYYLVGDISPQRVGRASSPYDAWEIGLTGMGRPVSAGHSLTVPGRTYADRRRANATYGSHPYATHNIHVTATAAVLNTRIGVDSTKTTTVVAGASYTLSMRVKLTGAAASRNLYAGLSLWDASNAQLTSLTGADVLVAPGDTATVTVTGSSGTGVKTRPFLTGKNLLAGESFELIDATLQLTAFPADPNMLRAEDQGPFTTSMGNWVDLGNSTQYLAPGEKSTYAAGTEPY